MALQIDEQGVAWWNSELGPEMAQGPVKARPADAIRELRNYGNLSGRQAVVADAYLRKHDPDYMPRR